MSFFDRNRRQLADRGIDPARLPPGQYFTDRFPVLHVGDVPRYEADLSDWALDVGGAVATPLTLSWEHLLALPATELLTDIHCVTKWSKFDTTWTGVKVTDLVERAGGLQPGASHLVAHAEYGYTANLPLTDALAVTSIVAYRFEGEPLEGQHGFPVRLVVPHLYFWKSVKWLRGLEFTTSDRPGFWERNGYHNYGDPFSEQRYWGD
jgi:DMSO/TMAO reductase YedYZ molybdopterin-dependent catalytic subunit